MWHWNTAWWSGTAPDADRALDEPAPWTPGGLMSLQARFWEEALAANRDWWRLMMSSLPSPALPPAGVVVPPENEEEQAKDVDVDATPLPRKPAAAAAARRLRPAAGPAGARIKHQRRQG